LVTIAIEWEVIDFMAERVLDFATNKPETENDISGNNRGGYGVPVEAPDYLEGEEQSVGPGYLGDGNAVGYGKGGVEDSVCST